MGMGYAAMNADVIDWKTIEKMCPTEATALVALLKKYEISSYGFSRYVEQGFNPEDLFSDIESDEAVDREELTEVDFQQAAEVEAAWKALSEAFTKATRVGESFLTLHPCYHNSGENGSRYDEVDGSFYAVEGAYQLSPAGEKFQDKFEHRTWVSFY